MSASPCRQAVRMFRLHRNCTVFSSCALFRQTKHQSPCAPQLRSPSWPLGPRSAWSSDPWGSLQRLSAAALSRPLSRPLCRRCQPLPNLLNLSRLAGCLVHCSMHRPASRQRSLVADCKECSSRPRGYLGARPGLPFPYRHQVWFFELQVQHTDVDEVGQPGTPVCRLQIHQLIAFTGSVAQGMFCTELPHVRARHGTKPGLD